MDADTGQVFRPDRTYKDWLHRQKNLVTKDKKIRRVIATDISDYYLLANRSDFAIKSGKVGRVDPAGISLQLTPYDNASLIRPTNADDLSHQAGPDLPGA